MLTTELMCCYWWTDVLSCVYYKMGARQGL
jgi:hypothetical protein